MNPKDVLKQMQNEYNQKIVELENSLVEYALEHNLDLELGDYGTGRSLILKDGHWSGKSRGEWLFSSETC